MQVDLDRFRGCLLGLAVGDSVGTTVEFQRRGSFPPMDEYRQKPMDSIRGTGYVVESLEAALWCFYQTETFDAAIRQAANLGDDADTTAAICGQIAGAFYGESGIPAKWREKLFLCAETAELADKLSRLEHL